MQNTKNIRVWDLAVRLFHWSLVSAITLSFITEDDLPDLHIYTGYFIIGLVLFRVIWGIIGSTHARFSDFVKSPGAIIAYLHTMVRHRAERYIGHNPAGGIMIVVILITLTIALFSGMALYGTSDFSGPMAGVFRGALAADILETTHEISTNGLLVLIALHLLGVVHSSLAHRENLVKSMFTGLKRSDA